MNKTSMELFIRAEKLEFSQKRKALLITLLLIVILVSAKLAFSQNASRATYFIKTIGNPASYGSGTAIGPQSILTVKHIFSDRQYNVIVSHPITQKQYRGRCTALHPDPKIDLALIYLPSTNLNHIH